MKKNPLIAKLTLLTLATALCGAGPAAAQVAGSSTAVGVAVLTSTQIASGWSVKKTLLGKHVYNDAGQKVGEVEDLIISPDKSVSYVIVGAGGFVGLGRHDVAIPVKQIQDQGGKLVLAGATKESIKALPAFDYAPDNAKRDQFIAAAEQDIAKGKAKLVALEKQTGAAATSAKTQLETQITALQGDVKTAEAKLGELKQAATDHWQEFAASVSAATARVRKAL